MFMNGAKRCLANIAIAVACTLCSAGASAASDADAGDVKAIIEKWVGDYQTNNAALQATHGTLEIGEPIYEEFNGNHAYLIFPATFSDTQQGVPVVYKGTWTMTLTANGDGWVFTGSASAWGVNSL